MEFDYILPSLVRHEQLLKFVERHQRVTVSQICEQFTISPATARRDLEALAERGEIKRFHGGPKPFVRHHLKCWSYNEQPNRLKRKRVSVGQREIRFIIAFVISVV